MLIVPFVSSPEGQELPFIANKLHSVKGERVPQRMLYPSQTLLAAAIADLPRGGGTLSAVRRSMAVRYGAEVTCPVTTQRLLRDIAETSAGRQAGFHREGRRGVFTVAVKTPSEDKRTELPGRVHMPLVRLKRG